MLKGDVEVSRETLSHDRDEVLEPHQSMKCINEARIALVQRGAAEFGTFYTSHDHKVALALVDSHSGTIHGRIGPGDLRYKRHFY